MESHRKRFETSDVQHTKSICEFYEFLSFVKELCPKSRKKSRLSAPKIIICFFFLPLVQYDIVSHS